MRFIEWQKVFNMSYAQVSTIATHAPASTRSVNVLPGQRGGKEAKTEDFASHVAPQSPDAEAIDAIFANYDLGDISPQEIDQMADELVAAGFDDMKLIMMLTTKGAAFQAHLQEDFAQSGYEVSRGNSNAKMDLIEVTRDQLKMSKAFGQPTQALESFLDDIEDIAAEQAAPPRAPIALVRGGDLGTLVLSQADRI
ncbi:hypothetical protein [Phaeobacter gallaeciensis]|uniref:hypothetical protein n=2 Tax=Phaeobacter gallaeciensis TaxID=60890 RepID=UPI00237F39FE|nr:hypothetical protein [Phaeobacter gallaeciensis]